MTVYFSSVATSTDETALFFSYNRKKCLEFARSIRSKQCTSDKRTSEIIVTGYNVGRVSAGTDPKAAFFSWSDSLDWLPDPVFCETVKDR